MIRFQRIGRINDPAFRIVVLEKERAAKAGNIVELLGTYNAKSKVLTLKEDRVKDWIARGAQPTGSIHNLLISKGIITGKKINVLSKKTPQKSAEAAVVEAVKPIEAAKTPEVAVVAEVPVSSAPSVVEVAVEAPVVKEVVAEVVVPAEEVVVV